MRVLHIDEQTGWRGGEQQASWLIQYLARAGHEVHLAGRPNSEFLFGEHGGVRLTCTILPMRGEWDLSSAWRLARMVSACHIDILHAHTSHAHMLACFARKFAGRGKVVVSRRVSFPPKPGRFNHWKYAQPDHFVCVSRHVFEVMREFGVPESRMTVVHSAVDPARLGVAPLERETLGVAPDAPLLVSAGALEPHKDHASLLAAMQRVLARFPKSRLVIAGEGSQRGALEAWIDARNLGAAVTLLGHRTDAPRLIRAGDVYVSSSVSEGLGTSILEALCCGTPVVAALAGGAAEMVRPGETGWLVPASDPEALANAIIACLENREQAMAMAENGKRLVAEQFTADRMGAGNLAVYEKLLAEDSAP